MKFNFDEYVDRHGTNSYEYDMSDELRAEYGMGKLPKDYIALDVADMDFRCAPCIKEAIQEITDRNLYGYCCLHPTTAPKYYEAIINWNEEKYGWKIKPEEIFYVAGTLEAITHVLKALTQPGDGVLIAIPVYTPFYDTIRKAGRTVFKTHLVNEDGKYVIDWEDFEKKVSEPSVKAFLLCSPHNPVGRVWSKEELKKMHEICKRHNVLIIADEIHNDMVRWGETFYPIAKVTGGKDVVVCTGANKSFNIASLGASHIVVQDPAFYEKVKAEVFEVYPTPFVISAVTAAYSQGREWQDEVRKYIDGNIDAAIDFFKEKMPKVKVRRPEGTYILWVDFSAYGLSDDEIYDRIVNRAAVLIEQGRAFDEDGGSAGFVRICTPTQRARLMEALERIARQFEEV